MINFMKIAVVTRNFIYDNLNDDEDTVGFIFN